MVEDQRQEQRRQSEEQQRQLAKTQALVEVVAASQTPAAPGREQAVAAAVTDIATGAATGDTRLRQALDLLQAGKVAEASGLLRAFADDKTARIREDSQQAATAWRNLGAIAGLRDPKAAREAYARAVMLDPDDTESLFWDGWLEKEAGDLAAAERSYRRLLALKESEPDSSEAYWARLGLGDIEGARGRLAPALAGYRAAQASAERITKSDPGNAGWQRDLSVSYEQDRRRAGCAGQSAGGAESLPRLPRDPRPSGQGRPRQRGLAARPVGVLREDRRRAGCAGQSAGGAESFRDSLAITRPSGQGRPRQRGLAARPVGVLRQDRRRAGCAGQSAGGAEILPRRPRHCGPSGEVRPRQRRLAARPVGVATNGSATC